VEDVFVALRDTVRQQSLLELVSKRDGKIPVELVPADDVAELVTKFTKIFDSINKDALAINCLTGRTIITTYCKVLDKGATMAYVKTYKYVEFYNIRGKPFTVKTIYLCPRTYQNYDLSYWEGLFIHELSHIVSEVRTTDEAYGLVNTKALPATSIQYSADTYRLIWDITMHASKNVFVEVVDAVIDDREEDNKIITSNKGTRKLTKLTKIKHRLGLKH